ncbi:MAG: anaerobic ribonucleoside-triphosphate reductase activating protein [Mobilitalea sp.]
MNYGTIKTCDIANGPGVRTSLFVSGCTHHCKGCFQAETWNFDYGTPYTDETETMLIESLKPSYIKGLTVLGGEPFEPENQRVLVQLLGKIRMKYPNINIWSYSGYLFEELTGQIEGTGRARCEVTDEILSYLDGLVDGKFMEEKKDISLSFRGSSNQRVINVQKSLREKQVLLIDVKK